MWSPYLIAVAAMALLQLGPTQGRSLRGAGGRTLLEQDEVAVLAVPEEIPLKQIWAGWDPLVNQTCASPNPEGAGYAKYDLTVFRTLHSVTVTHIPNALSWKLQRWTNKCGWLDATEFAAAVDGTGTYEFADDGRVQTDAIQIVLWSSLPVPATAQATIDALNAAEAAAALLRVDDIEIIGTTPYRIGLFQGPKTIAEREEELGSMDHILKFHSLDVLDFTKLSKEVLDEDKELIVNIEFFDDHDNLKGIVAGDYDVELDQFIEDAKRDGRSFTVRTIHEFNGNWYPWGVFFPPTPPKPEEKSNDEPEEEPKEEPKKEPEDTPEPGPASKEYCLKQRNAQQPEALAAMGDYGSKYLMAHRVEDFKTAWRYVVSKFRVAGVNVRFQLDFNVSNGFNDPTPLRVFYPGDFWVDQVVVTSYNRAYSSCYHLKWTSFEDGFEKTYNEIVSFIGDDVPMGIAETGTTSWNGDKELWLKETAEVLRTKFPRVREVTWFMIDKVQQGFLTDWQLTTEEQRSTFRQGMENLRTSWP